MWLRRSFRFSAIRLSLGALFLVGFFALSVSASALYAFDSTQSSCAPISLNNRSTENADSRTKWIKAQGPLQGIAVLTHGLNTDPSKMRAIAETLSRNGVEVLLVGLSGHTGNLETFKRVSRERWLQDLQQAYCLTRTKADQSKVPLIYVGYSLGGALGIDLSLNPSKGMVQYDRMILFAPAISIRSASYLVNVLKPAGKEFVLPSANHPDYRANAAGTTLAAYEALFDTVSSIEASQLEKVNIPTLIFIDPQDELVSFTGIQNLIRDNQLSKWRVFPVNNLKSTLRPRFKHLIIDEVSTGHEVWTGIQKAISQHLQGISFESSIPSSKDLCLGAAIWSTAGNPYCTSDDWIGCNRAENECTAIEK